MKLIITIVSNKDTENVLDKLSEARFSATRVSTTGLFLEGGHSCLFIGVEDSKVDDVFEVLQGAVTKRVVRQHGVKKHFAGHIVAAAG
ncbi:MAG: cyclic-di-AMP receptor [Anaerotruncus sp.]|nr:MAG: cyclic-di-AMP receptor [Anaerotruncus sp.]